MNVIQSNIAAENARRQFKISKHKNDKTAERLASGYRINRAADDTAGLSISEKLRWQVRGLSRASYNAQEGISLIQSADGTLGEIHAMLQRANELAVQAANGTMTEADRAALDAEVQQLKGEIDAASEQARFNDIRLFPDDGYPASMASMEETYPYQLTLHPASGRMAIQPFAAGRASHPALNAVSGGGAIADTIVNDMLPNAINQIFNAFPSLKQDVGNETIEMTINVTYIDGANKTLARAEYTYWPSGVPKRPVTMKIKVDSADFTLADAQGTGPRTEEMQSTIAHEFMHSVMQYTLTDGMSGRKGDKFPTWFVEGTAQLAGGGFPTQWNNTLLAYAANLTSENDTSQDANIKKYLQSYTPAGRPYGHGYLATAYMGYLANGKGAVTGKNIAAGMDKIFADLLNGKKFADAVRDHTGYTPSQLSGLFSSGDADLVEFVRKLTYASKGGAGSVITSSLGVGGTGILGVGPAGPNPPNPPNPPAIGGTQKALNLQVGALSGVSVGVRLFELGARALEMEDTNVRTQEACDRAIDEVAKAIESVSGIRSYYGAIQNRLEYTINNLDNAEENTAASESALRDADMAQESVRYAIQQILLQAGMSMMAQANQQPEMLLSLL